MGVLSTSHSVSPRKIYQSTKHMKLHLPKLLRNSVLACITAVAGIASTTVGTATFTGGVVAFALSSQQVVAAEYTYGTADNNVASKLTAPTADDTITFEKESGHLTEGGGTINASAVINQLKLTNGYSGAVYTFNGTVTGTGEFTFAPTTTANNNDYVFNGDMSGYSGDMTIASNKGGSFTFNNITSGTGTITATNTTGKVVANGATMQNSAISVGKLEVSGVTSFAGTITSSATSIAAGSVVTLGGATNSLGALTLNVSALTSTSTWISVYGRKCAVGNLLNLGGCV